MHISSRPITLLDFAKLAILGIYLNYYCYNILKGQLIPNGTTIFFVIAVACVIVSMFQERIRFGAEIKCWLLYLVFSLITIPLAVSSSAALEGINKYLQRLVIIMMIAYICEHEKSVKFAIRLLAITAIACAVSCLIMNTGISTKLEMESGAIISTNDVGSIMAFGCFAVLFAFGLGENKGVVKIGIKIAYIIAAVAVIFLAGSRKSILAIFILFGLLFLLCARDYFKNISGIQLVLISLLIIGAVVFVYFYLLPNMESTDLYQRVFGRKAEGAAISDEGRLSLYELAWSKFIEYPVYGLGFNNLSFINGGTYSHSTYAEPLACSGIGGFLYLAPYVMILIKQIKLIKLNNLNQQERLWQKELLAFYISFLFVGIGIPYIYKDIPCIILAMFIASQKISYDKLKEQDNQPITEGASSEPITNKGITGTV
jgi:hypothetical protein